MNVNKRRSAGKPSLREQRQMLCENLSFSAAEAYKLLRTNLTYTIPNDTKCHIVGVTSSVRGEGKTTTAINLSYTLAQTGAKVLLIDADMRLPSIAKRLALDSKLGLSTILAGLCQAEETIQSLELLENWYIMPSGNIPPNPAELLGSENMRKVIEKLSNDYEYIVIDLPPVNIVSDALIVSNVVDGMLVAVRQNYSDRRSLNDCMRQLQLLDTRLLGFVMTDSQEITKKYGRYHYKKYGKSGKYKYAKYSYDYGYGYGYGKPQKEEAAKDGSATEETKETVAAGSKG